MRPELRFGQAICSLVVPHPPPFETESPSWDHMVPKCSQGPAGKETRKMKRVPTSVTSKICQFERDKKADGPGYWHVGGRRMNPKDLCTS